MKLTIRFSTWHVVETYKGRGKKMDIIEHVVPEVLVAGETQHIRRIAKSKEYLSRMIEELRKQTGRNIKLKDVKVKKIELSTTKTFGKGVGCLD
jgi:acetyl-CoA carboxylase alpha subunit